MKTSLGQVWGEETNPTLLPSREVTGTHSWGAQPAESGVLTKGHVTPGAGSGDCVGLTPDTWVGILYLGTLYLLCVLSPWRFPTSELRVLPWLTCGPFPSVHLVAFTWGQAPWVGCCSVFCWVKTFGSVILMSQHIKYLICRVTTVWCPLGGPQVI